MEAGIWDETVVVFTTDNGGIGPGSNYPLRGAKVREASPVCVHYTVRHTTYTHKYIYYHGITLFTHIFLSRLVSHSICLVW